MKTRTLTALLAMLITLSINSKTQITMYDIKGHTPPHNSGIPIVDSDGDEIIIKSDSTIYNVDVVIRDQFGNVMHHSTQNIGPMETTISILENNDISEMTTIDIYYDRKHLSGYFE